MDRTAHPPGLEYGLELGRVGGAGNVCTYGHMGNGRMVGARAMVQCLITVWGTITNRE